MFVLFLHFNCIIYQIPNQVDINDGTVYHFLQNKMFFMLLCIVISLYLFIKIPTIVMVLIHTLATYIHFISYF